MILYSEEKIINAISYIAFKHKELSGKVLYKTALFKFLALFYYKILEEVGEPPFEVSFKAMERGPVPDEVLVSIDELDNFGAPFFQISYEPNDDGTSSPKVLIESKSFNLDYFSDFEIEVLDNLLDRYSSNYKNNKELIEASHELIPWKKAWSARGSKNMNHINDLDIFSEESKTKSSYDHYKTLLAFKSLENAHTIW